MTREQYERMRQAAQDLVQLHRGGAQVDRLSVAWAQEVLASRYLGPPLQPALLQGQVARALEQAPIAGMTAQEVAQACGLSQHKCAVTLCYMVKQARAFMLKIPTRSRFFADAVALAQGRPLVEAAERQRAALITPPKPPKPAKPPKRPKPVPSKPALRPSTLPKKGTSAARRGVRAPQDQAVYLPSMLPQDVHIVALPSKSDMRFTPIPPIEGIGAVAAWNKLTRRKRAPKGSPQ